MSWLLIFAAIVVVQAVPNHKPQFEAFSDELIRYVNEESGATWKAAPPTRFNNFEHFKQHFGALEETLEERNARRPTIRYNVSENDLPESFDARQKWPMCSSISEIRDQSSCSSCWAVATASAMTDRICIKSNGQKKPRLSSIDITACCNYCGYGCQGGIPSMAWDYWWRDGVVTGGTLEDPTGCLPYPFPKCSHGGGSKSLLPCPREIYPTPQCEKKCRNGYEKKYEEDKIKGKLSYNVGDRETDIMTEIMTNGPVEGIFYIFEDFYVYKSGIYHYTTGRLIGGHAIRIIGWGVENGVKYWLVANSWNEEWGEKGYFRMRRGTNECGIEARINAGTP